MMKTTNTMKTAAFAAALAASALLCGCFNIAVRVSPYAEIDQCYLATSMDAEMVAAPFKKDCDFMDLAQKEIAIPLLPFTVIDLPFEFALDTLFLPYDYAVSRNAKNGVGDGAGKVEAK